MSADIKETLPERIKQARAMAGLSLRSLASATNGTVSHNAIARYEKGVMLPGSAALSAIAEGVRQPLDYFIRPFHSRLELKHIRFRRRVSKLGNKTKKALQDRALDFFERYCEIEEILGVRHEYSNPLGRRSVSNGDQVVELAKELRSKWNLGSDPLPNIHELMELKGIKVHELQTDETSFDGFSAETESGPVVVIADWLNRDIPRKRMTEVHELAHVLLEIPEDMDERAEEEIVWAFAGELLMPKNEFVDKFGYRTRVTLSELIALKRHFGVSIMALVNRAGKLGLIKESAKVGFFKYASREKWRQIGEPGKNVYSGSESNNRFRTLVHRAFVEQRISVSKAAALLGESIERVREDLRGVTFK